MLSQTSNKLIGYFYVELAKGSDYATSLTAARDKVKDQPEYEHPYYWAPFVLIGGAY